MSKLTLADFTGPTRSSGSQTVYQLCPTCGDDQWHVYMDPSTGIWMCFAGIHGAGGKVDIGLPPDDPGAIMDHMVRTRYDQEWEPEECAVPATGPLNVPAASYLLRRGIHPLAAENYLLRCMSGTTRILVPFYWKGQCVYWTARSYVPGQELKYLSAPGKHALYLPPLCQCVFSGGAFQIILVEGVFDAMAVGCTYNRPLSVIPVALCGKTLPRYLLRNLLTLSGGCGIIYVMMDNDATHAAYKISRQLEPYYDSVRIIQLPTGEDPASLHAKGKLNQLLERNL